MDTRIARSMVGVMVSLLLATPLAAHHNLVAQFAMNKSVSLRGTLTKMEWTNPHGWIYLSVKGDKGQVEDWAIETGSPYAMMKRGLTKNDFKPGIEIVVSGYAARDGSRSVAGMVVTFLEREVKSPGQEATFTLGR